MADGRANNGGARPGAGMKEGTKTERTMERRAREAAMVEYFVSLMPEIHAALHAKALTGDVQAIKEIHERIYGKVTEKLEADFTSDGEKIMGINYIVPNGNNVETDNQTTPGVSSTTGSQD